jgi:hypothetical protein
MRSPDEPGPDGPLETPGGLTIALYPNCYVWYVFLASLDIMLTWIILSPPFLGREVNWLANKIIEFGGLHAMIPYKFALVFVVISICEIVGRANRDRGRRLAEWSVAITSIPVIVAFTQLIVDTYELLFSRPKILPL